MAAGFGFISTQQSAQYAIKVSENVDYEVSFWFIQPTTLPTFEVSCKCFDCNFVAEIHPLDVRNGSFNNIFLPGNVPICGTPNKWNFFHCVLYNKNQTVDSNDKPLTSHDAGTNLIMRAGIKKLFVNVTCVTTCMILQDFKVKPLKTPFSTGFIQSSGLTEIWNKNNKPDLTNDQVALLANKFLFPYDAAISVINI